MDYFVLLVHLSWSPHIITPQFYCVEIIVQIYVLMKEL